MLGFVPDEQIKIHKYSIFFWCFGTFIENGLRENSFVQTQVSILVRSHQVSVYSNRLAVGKDFGPSG